MNTQKLRDMNLNAVADELEQLRAFKAEVEKQEPEQYDAGFLNDFGGGNVSWWHDYIRAELDRAHDHYAEQFNVPADKPAVAVPDVADEEMLEVGVETLRRGLKLFPDNLYQVISNVWEDMYESAPSHSQQSEEAGVSALVEALEEARLTLDVLQGRGSSVKLTLAIIDRALAAYRKGGDHCPSHESEQGGNDV